jgi:hypothetical protein
MSLSITDITEHGIVMVADTALVEQIDDTASGNFYGFRTRTLLGARKLFAHVPAKAGLATWGAGTFPGGIATQFVIEKFLDGNQTVLTVRELAEELRYMLNTFYGVLPAVLGIHVAGMIKTKTFQPVCYEIRNANPPYVGVDIHDFELVELMAPQEIADAGHRRLFVGGDARLFRPLTDSIETALAAVKADGLIVPAEHLQARREFFAAHLRFVSDLYATALRPRSIGADAMSLSIGPAGQFYDLP